MSAKLLEKCSRITRAFAPRGASGVEKAVIVDGRILKQGGRSTALDLAEIKAHARETLVRVFH